MKILKLSDFDNESDVEAIAYFNNNKVRGYFEEKINDESIKKKILETCKYS